MSYSIRKVKEFKRLGGPPQFEVLMRKYYECRENNEVYIHFSVMLDPLSSKGEVKEGKHTVTIESEDKSLIKQVKRIKDGLVFSYQEMVWITVKDKEVEGFLLEFKEDLIHCVVFDMAAFNPYLVEIDDIKAHPATIIGDGDEEYIDEDLEEMKKDWIKV